MSWAEVRVVWAIVLQMAAWLSLIWVVLSTSIPGMVIGVPCAGILIIVTGWIREAATVALQNERRAHDGQGR